MIFTYCTFMHTNVRTYLSHGVHVHYIQSIFSAGDAANVDGVLEVFASYRQKKDACSRMEKVGSSSVALSSHRQEPQQLDTSIIRHLRTYV